MKTYRESTVNIDHRKGDEYLEEEVRRVHDGKIDVAWITDERGIRIAAVIQAADVHEPGKCCCKHCPWQGNHG